jgi:hypothetical protein
MCCPFPFIVRVSAVVHVPGGTIIVPDVLPRACKADPIVVKHPPVLAQILPSLGHGFVVSVKLLEELMFFDIPPTSVAFAIAFQIAEILAS